MSILVVGGAGYIGATVVHLLHERGEKVVVVDDLSYGDAARIGNSKLVVMDVAEGDAQSKLAALMKEEGVTAVIHFAARKQVGESVEKPMWYYQQNIGGLANMMAAMEEAGVNQMIFSSSAAVYGAPPVAVVDEDIVKQPINPYGETKLIGEWMMADCERAFGLRWIGLRYFNVAGAASPELGDPAVLNLVPMVLQKVAQGQPAKIFGTDYDTPDGTCIRDYIHVQDLAEAHIAALDYIAADKPMSEHTFNVGTGTGTSVRQIVDGLKKVVGRDFAVEETDRRAGDPPQLIGNPSRINKVLGWNARFDMEDILTSSYEAWQAGDNPIS